MKIDENGVLKEIEESDIVDGVLIIPDSVKEIFSILKPIEDMSNSEFALRVGLSLDDDTEDELITNKIKKVIIGENVTEIEFNAFKGCKMLQEIEFSSNSKLKTINPNAFIDCESLKEINIPNGTERIGADAFRGCSKLKKLTTPQNSSIVFSDKSFEGCASLEELHILGYAEELNVINEELDDFFYDDAKRIVEFGPKVKAINSILPNLKAITVPSGVKEIEAYAFEDCRGLTEVKLPEGLERIGMNAFCLCKGLTKIELLKGLKSIGDSAFLGCTNLTEIELPEGLERIGEFAFLRCKSLTEIKLPEGIENIEEHTFEGCTSLTGIKLPKELKSIGTSAFEGCTSLTGIELPEGLESIGVSAFADCEGLTEIRLPETLKTIGRNAFRGYTGLIETKSPEKSELKGEGDVPAIADPETTKPVTSKSIAEADIKRNISNSEISETEDLISKIKNFLKEVEEEERNK